MNTDIKNQHHILEAIDQLRRRKARPDIDRICNFVTKRFAVDSRDTKADLQRCVENSIVYKVEYKGSISYRNAAKKSYGQVKKDPHLNSIQQSIAIAPTTTTTTTATIAAIAPAAVIATSTNLINSSHILENKIEMSKLFANIVTTVVADLYLEDSDYLEFGVPLNNLVKRILTKHPSKFSKKTIIDLLQQEVDNGGLIKMETGNFSLGPSSQTEKNEDFLDDDDDYLTVNTSCDGSPPMKIRKKPGPKPGKRKNEMEKLRNFEESSNIGIRLGGRRKRAKKVFDPSDNNLPRLNRKRGRPLGSLNKSTIEKQTAAMMSARSQGTSSVNSNYNSNSNNASDQSPGSRPTSRASSTGPMGGGNSSSGSIGAGSIPRDTNQGGVCSVCHLQGKKGVSDKMISCRECSNKAHVACLNTDDGMLRMYPDNTWQCPHCKTCVVCYETSDAGSLTVCQICADAYHSFCHEPKIPEKSKGGFKWVCGNCQMEPLLSDIKTEIKQEIDEKEEKVSLNLSLEPSAPSSPHSNESTTPYTQSPANSPIPPTLSPQNTQNNLQNGNGNGNQDSCDNRDNRDNRNSIESTTISENYSGNNNNTRIRTNSGSDYKFYNMSDSQSIKDFEIDETFDPSIPDASNWTYDDVYNYFVQYFPEEAIVFKEQEIDGHSLLLMKRVDVLTSLNLKLGPALKIYRHVLKLQVRRDDHKLYWL